MRILAAFAAGMSLHILGYSIVGAGLYLLFIKVTLRLFHVPDTFDLFFFLQLKMGEAFGARDLSMLLFALVAGATMAFISRRWAYLVAILVLTILYLGPGIPGVFDFVTTTLDGALYLDFLLRWPYALTRNVSAMLVVAAATLLGVHLCRRLLPVAAG